MLEKLLNAFRKLSHSCSIVDLGCGKGRVMVVAAYFGFTRITGIDFAKELCKEAIANMSKTELLIPGINWQVINKNVVDMTFSLMTRYSLCSILLWRRRYVFFKQAGKIM